MEYKQIGSVSLRLKSSGGEGGWGNISKRLTRWVISDVSSGSPGLPREFKGEGDLASDLRAAWGTADLVWACTFDRSD